MNYNSEILEDCKTLVDEQADLEVSDLDVEETYLEEDQDDERPDSDLEVDISDLEDPDADLLGGDDANNPGVMAPAIQRDVVCAIIRDLDLAKWAANLVKPTHFSQRHLQTLVKTAFHHVTAYDALPSDKDLFEALQKNHIKDKSYLFFKGETLALLSLENVEPLAKIKEKITKFAVAVQSTIITNKMLKSAKEGEIDYNALSADVARAKDLVEGNAAVRRERVRAELAKVGAEILEEETVSRGKGEDEHYYYVECPCCGGDGAFVAVGRTQGRYECATSGKKSWKDGKALYSRRNQKVRFISIKEVFDIPDTTFLIDRHIKEMTLSIIYGPSGVAKSFYLLGMSMCVATGRPFLGQYECLNPDGRPVVYLYSEASPDAKYRIAAWQHYHGVSDEELEGKLILYPGSLYLTQDKPTDDFIESLTEYCGEKKPCMIVVDTLSMNFIGDESSGEDMGAFIRNCGLLRRAFGCSVVVVHHTGKDEAKGLRGSSKQIGDFDTIIRLHGSDLESGSYRAVAVTQEKQKDSEPLPKYKLDKTVVPCGEGSRASSLVLVPSTGQVEEEKTKEPVSKNRFRNLIHYGIIHNECMPAPDEAPVSKSVLKSMVDKAVAERRAKDPNQMYQMGRDAIYRYVNELVGLGHVVEVPSESGNDKHKTYRKAEHGCVDFLLIYGGAEAV